MGRSRELAELAASYDSGNLFGMKNRIINGDMRIDQRNAGASVAITTGVYGIDRWYLQSSVGSSHTAQRSTTAPAGFKNSNLITIGTGATPTGSNYFRFRQAIEGFNAADLNWGTSDAQTVTVSFWVRSSLTGTFGVGVLNDAGNRSYIASYTISSANTWEQKTVTIPGDQSGTWLTDNSVGIYLGFDIGEGPDRSKAAGSWGAPTAAGFGLTSGVKIAATSGATWYVTGVQLEKGSTATSFDYRPYGTELALCQRYYQVAGLDNCAFAGRSASTTVVYFSVPLSVALRASPTVSDIGATYLYSNLARTNSSGGSTAVNAFNVNSTIIGISKSGFTGLTNDNIYNVGSIASSLTLSAEL